MEDTRVRTEDTRVRRILRLAFLAALVSAVSAQTPAPDLGDTDLENLLKIKVTSVSRTEKSVSLAAGAVFVITQEDIRRSGLSSIPELLRMAPGIDVAHIDGNKWAITARGFNERFADKMLVMVDGRSVISPLSSGVYWDVQDTVMEDIDRIEVVRGPGAALWGANAVDGVINIITKKAKATQGALVSTGSGSANGNADVTMRYGGEFGRSGYYRIFAKDDRTGDSTDAAGNRAADSFRMFRGGFRADWDLSTRDAFTVQGDLYRGNAGQTGEGLTSLSPPARGVFSTRSPLDGGNILGRWQHASSKRFDTSVQAYVEADDRNQTGVLDTRRRTADFELLQHFAAANRHDLTWGGGYRHDDVNARGGIVISFDPPDRGTNLVGAFAQDEISILPDRLWLTAGVKLEHNSYSGFALQPNIRLLWARSPTESIWIALSRAAENSSRVDADIRVNQSAFTGADGVTVVNARFGNPNLPPETVLASELGYRRSLNGRMNLDIAAFYNEYMDRHTQEPAAPFFEGSGDSLHLVQPTVTASNISGETHGIEFSQKTVLTKTWELTAGYTFLAMHLHAAPGSQDLSTARDTEGGSPRHKFQLRSTMNLSRNIQFDTALYYVGRLPGPQIPQYARVDARLGWKISGSIEISAGGQNLLDRSHFEFASGNQANATSVYRNFYGRIVWRH